MDYNGWKNKETWLVNLWLGDCFQEYIEAGIDVTPDFIKNMVESMFNDMHEPSVEWGLITDLMQCAFNEIDWHEIAAHHEVAMA